MSGENQRYRGVDVETDDLTIHVLREIRDEMRAMNQRIDITNGRLDGTNLRLERLEDRLTHEIERTRLDLMNQIAQSEIRSVTAIHGLGGTLNDVHALFRDQLDLRPRVERCERELADLRERMD
jgi:predicted  nucleic acid-binding Zn-ribbon protein